MPRFCPLAALFIISLLLTFSSGCACNCGTCRESSSPEISGGAGNVVKRNLSEVEMIIEMVEARGNTEYLLTGRILTARPVGSASNIAEVGQIVEFIHSRPVEGTNPADESIRRLVARGPSLKGAKVNCTITLGRDGTWQIVAVH